MRILLLLVLTAIFTSDSKAQNDTPSVRGGLELQVYPTGILPGLRLEVPSSQSAFWTFRAGMNLIDHRDLGVHDDEEGSGWGFTLGHKWRLGSSSSSRWSLEPRCDVWFNKLDWVDLEFTPAERRGTSKIVVVQPTLSLGYRLTKEDSPWNLTPTLSFGFEENIHTNGEPTGEGFILLVGLQATHSL